MMPSSWSPLAPCLMPRSCPGGGAVLAGGVPRRGITSNQLSSKMPPPPPVSAPPRPSPAGLTFIVGRLLVGSELF